MKQIIGTVGLRTDYGARVEIWNLGRETHSLQTRDAGGSDCVDGSGGREEWTYLSYFDGSIKCSSDGLDKRGDL